MKHLRDTNKISIDTNIVIYAIENKDKRKVDIALKLLEMNPYLSNHVLSETLRVLSSKRFNMNKENIINSVLYLLDFCPLIINDVDIYKSAKFLMKKYQISLFDSVVVAGALLEGCSILYTEDMHNGLLIEKKLKIINPFI